MLMSAVWNNMKALKMLYHLGYDPFVIYTHMKKIIPACHKVWMKNPPQIHEIWLQYKNL